MWQDLSRGPLSINLKKQIKTRKTFNKPREITTVSSGLLRTSRHGLHCTFTAVTSFHPTTVRLNYYSTSFTREKVESPKEGVSARELSAKQALQPRPSGTLSRPISCCEKDHGVCRQEGRDRSAGAACSQGRHPGRSEVWDLGRQKGKGNLKRGVVCTEV